MKHSLLLLLVTCSVLLSSLALLSSPVRAEPDAPDVNVTRRRPDRPANYFSVPSPQNPEIKQVQTSSQPWYSRLWERLVSFFR